VVDGGLLWWLAKSLLVSESLCGGIESMEWCPSERCSRIVERLGVVIAVKVGVKGSETVDWFRNVVDSVALLPCKDGFFRCSGDML
jgi:hypothetical protein